MNDVLVFPDARSAVFDLINDAEHVGQTVHAYYQMPVDYQGTTTGPFPLALVGMEPGNQGFLDRTDRVVVTVYGEGSAPTANVAESIHASLIGFDIETPSGYLDEIQPDQPPYELAYYSETINQVQFRIMVTTRPIA